MIIRDAAIPPSIRIKSAPLTKPSWHSHAYNTIVDAGIKNAQPDIQNLYCIIFNKLTCKVQQEAPANLKHNVVFVQLTPIAQHASQAIINSANHHKPLISKNIPEIIF